MKSVHWFLVSVIVWSGLFWWSFALSSSGIMSIEIPALFVPIGGLGLLLVTVVFAYKEAGWSSVRSLFSRSLCVRLNAGIWLMSAVPAMLLLAVLVGVTWLYGDASGTGFGIDVGPLLLGIAFLAWIEEFVWRGYALPRLLKHHTPFWASFWLGLIWLPFHLPFFLMPGYNAWGMLGWLAWASWYFLYPFFLTWLSIRGRFSILLVTFSHFLVNWVIGWFEPAHMENIGALGATPLLLILLLLIWKRGADDIPSTPRNRR